MNINSKKEMKNVLVTGYSGFLGSHLLNELNGKYGLKLLGRREPTIDCEFFKSSINESTDYSSIMTDVDVVIHVAARVHIMDDDVTDPLSEFRAVNTKGTLNLARHAARIGVKRFIFMSSVKVNGESTINGQAFSNNDKACPEDAYGISKAEAESELMQLSDETGLEVVIIRAPLVYGEGVKANFAALINLVTKKLPLPLGAINKNHRSLVSVYNLVHLIERCICHPNATNQIFLVSDGHDLSTTEMVKLIAKAQGVKPLLIPVPVRALKFIGEITGKFDIISRLTESLQVDITHTKNTLDWMPPYSVEEGFVKCIQVPNHSSNAS